MGKVNKNKSFTEDDIRPANLDAGKMKALYDDLDRLRNNLKSFVKVDCPACGSSKKKFEFNKYDFNFVKCKECKTVYMNPRATKEILNEFYSNSIQYEYWNKYIFPASRKMRMKRIFRPRVEKIIDICKAKNIKKDLIVEIGSASGMFTEELKLNGNFKRIIGIEPGKAQAETSKSVGVEIIESTLENLTSLDEKANILCSFETIEHVFSPKLFLQKCYEIMGSNSLLILTCPNYEGFDISEMGVNSESLDAEHINLFNPNSIKILLEDNGFTINEITTPGNLDAEIVRKNILNKKLNISSNKFLEKVLIDEWEKLGDPFQEFLKNNCLSSHMWISAIKK